MVARFELTDWLANVLFFRVPQHIKFGLIGPKDNARIRQPMQGNAGTINKNV